MTECPGAKPKRNLEETEVVCPSCGAELEFFSDEIERRCKCGATVQRDGTLGSGSKTHEHVNPPFEGASDPKAHEQVEDVSQHVKDATQGQ